eukprot:292727_1
MGQCSGINKKAQQRKLIGNSPLPTIKQPTINTTVRYLDESLQRRLVHNYCLNVKENLPLDVIQIIIHHYFGDNIPINPILIQHQKLDSLPLNYVFKHHIIGSQHININNSFTTHDIITWKQQFSKNNECKTEQQIKILLLGANNSGKSTIFNQLRYIYDGVDQVELDNNKPFLSLNIIETIRTLAIFSNIFQDAIHFANCSVYPSIKDTTVEPQNRLIRDRISRMASNETLTSKDYDDLIQLTNDKGIQKTLHCRPHIGSSIVDSCQYIFPNVKYYKQTDYIQTIDDFLWTYKRTRAPPINSFSFQYNTILYDICDAPDKPHRREWTCTPLFNNVSILMFVINLDGYHRVYHESCGQNRCLEMRDTMNVLRRLLCYAPMPKCLILIFNKMDLFEESITRIDFQEEFSDFKGDTQNKVDVINYTFRKCLDQIMRANDKHNITQIHCLVTNALNTQCIKNVFDYIHLNVVDSL